MFNRNINTIIKHFLWAIILWIPMMSLAQIDDDDIEVPFDDTPFEFDFNTLELQRPLIDSQASQSEFDQLTDEFLAIMRKLEAREEYAYSKTFLSKMVEFIQNHPNESAALTVKLCLAEYLVKSFFHSPIGTVALQDGLTVYDAIQADFPETWQGKTAVLYKTMAMMYQQTETERVAEYKRLFPFARELEQNQEFIRFQQLIGNYEPIGFLFHGAIIYLELQQGNLTNAETEFTILQQEYPELAMWRIKEIENDIAQAHEYQFDGNFITYTVEELLQFLTSSQEKEGTIRKAAAALGNLAIRGIRDISDTQKQVIYTVVLSYIDRALSGDAAERDAMIDLIYRLWHLAAPALLEMLDHANHDRVAFAGDRLLYMRNEEIITAMIEKARAVTDETKKAQLIGLLARMNEPCLPVMRFRECLPDEQLQELYQRLVVPALEELQGQALTPTP